MRTARWGWYATAEDKQELPFAVPGHQPPPPIPYLFDDTKATAVSAFAGWPIYCDDAIPATLGAEENQDVIVAARPTDSMLFESVERTTVKTEVLSGTMQARFQLYRYAAFLPRYPTGFGFLAGTGLKVQSGY
jgi:hypothetical protein